MRALQYFYDIIYKATNSPRADYKESDIASIHIGRYLSESNNKLHLHLGELDNDYFRTIIQLGTPENTIRVKKKSHERLRNTYSIHISMMKSSAYVSYRF